MGEMLGLFESTSQNSAVWPNFNTSRDLHGWLAPSWTRSIKVAIKIVQWQRLAELSGSLSAKSGASDQPVWKNVTWLKCHYWEWLYISCRITARSVPSVHYASCHEVTKSKAPKTCSVSFISIPAICYTSALTLSEGLVSRVETLPASPSSPIWGITCGLPSKTRC